MSAETKVIKKLIIALRDCMKELKSHRDWEPIEAAPTEDGEATYKGYRCSMPAGLVEIANKAGRPPEEMTPMVSRWEEVIEDALPFVKGTWSE